MASYLQLARNERHPETRVSTVRVLDNFGRAETVDRAGLARLVSSISRFPATPSRRSLQRPPARGRGAGLAAAGRGVGARPGLGTAGDRCGDPPGRCPGEPTCYFGSAPESLTTPSPRTTGAGTPTSPTPPITRC